MPAPLTTQQLADKLGVSRELVAKWLREKRLKPLYTLPSGQHLFARSTKRPKALKRGPKPRG